MQMRFSHSKTLFSLLVDFFMKRAQICAWNAWWNAKRKTEITWNNAKNVSLTQHGNAIVKKKKSKRRHHEPTCPNFDKITYLRHHFLVYLYLVVTSAGMLHRERKRGPARLQHEYAIQTELTCPVEMTQMRQTRSHDYVDQSGSLKTCWKGPLHF